MEDFIYFHYFIDINIEKFIEIGAGERRYLAYIAWPTSTFYDIGKKKAFTLMREDNEFIGAFF